MAMGEKFELCNMEFCQLQNALNFDLRLLVNIEIESSYQILFVIFMFSADLRLGCLIQHVNKVVNTGGIKWNKGLGVDQSPRKFGLGLVFSSNSQA